MDLEQMWALIREEVKPTNHPLSFTTQMFCDEVGVGKTTAHRHLNKLLEEGRVIKIEQYYQKDKNGVNHAVPGWQWVEK